MKGFLNRDPKKRLGANGINKIMSHPFFKDINWIDVENKKLSPPYIPKVKWIYNNMTHIVDSSQDMIMPYEEKKERYMSNFSYTTEELPINQLQRKAY